MVDTEAIVIDQLVNDDDVTAVTTEVLARTPDNVRRPWARVTLTDEYATDGRAVRHLVNCSIQIDCFAGTEGTQEEAFDLAAAVREVVEALPEAELEGAVVTATITRKQRMDDATFTPPMPRYIVGAEVWVHEA